MAIATTGKDVLAKFFDEGAYSALYADGAVTAAFGSANGTPVYAVCQTGAAVAEKDTEKVVKVLDMAAKTGNPVVTFYNSVGAKLEEGLAALSGSAAVAAAVAAFRERTVNRIILTRPAVEAGERLGFLPGDLQNKVDPYLRPLYDALFDMMGPENFQKYQERGAIEVAPLAYMRGRTLDDSFIILDEAQNTTREQMKMFLTRLGFGSKIVITGDTTQIDLPPDKISGLKDAVRVLDGVKDIAICRLTAVDVVRHALVQEIIKAYERHERPKEPEKKPDIRKKQK